MSWQVWLGIGIFALVTALMQLGMFIGRIQGRSQERKENTALLDKVHVHVKAADEAGGPQDERARYLLGWDRT